MRKDQLAFFVFLIFDVDFYLVADFQVGIVTELADGDDAVGLVADVDDYLAFVDADDGSLDNLVFVHLVEGGVIRLFQLCFRFLGFCGAVFIGIQSKSVSGATFFKFSMKLFV